MNFIIALAHLVTDGLSLWAKDYTSNKGISGSIEYHSHSRPIVKTNEAIVNYQIDAPSTDYGYPDYTQVLLLNEFGASWGKPFTVDYEPPNVEFSHVKLLLEVSSFGIQYDRLAHIYLNGVEIWRPSTSEPRGRASYSNFTKDVSQYLSLFTQPGVLSFELNNLVTERLNGTFTATLSAEYFKVPAEDSATSTGLSPNTWFEHEGTAATRIRSILEPQVAVGPLKEQLPQLSRNTTRAVLQVFASGNGNDEFWYAQSGYSDDEDRTGPLRHLIVGLEGELAGAISPFYQIYTGGFQPALWTPFVAPNAYDVPAYEIDLTPFLPLLWEKSTHMDLKVLDLYDQLVQHEWIVSSSLFTWETEGLEGKGTTYPTEEKNTTSKVHIQGIEVATFTQQLNISASIQFNNGPLTPISWLQTRDVESSIVGGTVISHSSSGKSLTTYAERNYSRSHHYNLGLVLNEDSIVLAEGYRIYDAGIEPSSSQDLLSRSYSVQYNGSWYEEAANASAAFNTPLHSLHGHNDRVNGSDVFVRLRDPYRVGPETYRQHATSRNGTAIDFNASYDITANIPSDDASETEYLSALIGGAVSDGTGFPFMHLSNEKQQDRQRIRRKWLKHGI